MGTSARRDLSKNFSKINTNELADLITEPSMINDQEASRQLLESLGQRNDLDSLSSQQQSSVLDLLVSTSITSDTAAQVLDTLQEVSESEDGDEIDGKKMMADVVKLPSGEVIIKVGDGKKSETIVTDQKGLLEFNKKYTPAQILYNDKAEQKPEEEKVDPSLYSKIMQNLALASMMLGNRSNLTQMNINNMNQQMLEQQQMLTNMMMHQQAVQDHMTAVQMSTPGMGFI